MLHTMGTIVTDFTDYYCSCLAAYSHVAFTRVPSSPKLLLFCHRCFLFVFAPTICKETSALSCHRITRTFIVIHASFFFVPFLFCSFCTRNGMFQLFLRIINNCKRMHGKTNGISSCIVRLQAS